MITSIIPPDKLLFGQFLIENKIISHQILEKALKEQAKESSEILKDSHRLLGQILLEEFNVFRGRLELNTYLKKFKQFKDDIEKLRYDAKIFGKKD